MQALPVTALVLLHAGSGTSQAAGATNVDTIALSGLTLLDSIWVLASMVSKTQVTAAPSLLNSTDGVALATAPAQVGLAITNFFEWTARQDKFSATNIITKQTTFDAGNAGVLSQTLAAFATAWTAPWTLALRHGGVTAGGTLNWSWAVYKIAGQ